MIDSFSPRRTWMSMPFRTSNEPKLLCRSTILSSGSMTSAMRFRSGQQERPRAARPNGASRAERGGVLEAVVAVRRVPALGTVDADPEVLFLRRRREPTLVAEAVLAHHLDV